MEPAIVDGTRKVIELLPNRQPFLKKWLPRGFSGVFEEHCQSGLAGTTNVLQGGKIVLLLHQARSCIIPIFDDTAEVLKEPRLRVMRCVVGVTDSRCLFSQTFDTA